MGFASILTSGLIFGEYHKNFILALFGHEQNQQEMGQKFSSLSLQQYKELANCLNNMQHAYQIDGMYEHA